MSDLRDTQTRVYRVEAFSYLFAAVTVVLTIVGLTVLLPDALEAGASTSLSSALVHNPGVVLVQRAEVTP